MATRRTATKAAPAPEPVELEEDEFEETDEVEETDEDDDLEELEEAEEEPETKPKRKPPVRKTEPKAKAPKAPAIEFGSAWLAAHVTEQTGETYDGRAVRMLLRKLAKDGKLPRVVGETRDRYQFTGPQDATVLAVVKMVKDGTAKALRQEGLEKVKTQAAAAKAAGPETEDMEEDDEDVVEETPAPKPRRTATKTAAPAKATPATKRRTAAAK
jgi:antitoxin component of RelBE/YafQ-DinJ toxin-antitoxin module